MQPVHNAKEKCSRARVGQYKGYALAFTNSSSDVDALSRNFGGGVFLSNVAEARKKKYSYHYFYLSRLHTDSWFVTLL